MEKDYYHILQIPPSSSEPEIKKAFRKLAHTYHPDKQPGNDWADSHFAQIYEAYAVLSDRDARKQYDRRIKGNHAKVFKQPATATDVLDISIALQRKLSRLDPFRTDRDLVHYEVLYVLSPANMQILRHAGDADINRQVLTHIIRCAPYLPQGTIRQITPILRELTIADHGAKTQVELFIRNTRLGHYWNRYKIWLALLVAILFCLFVYRQGK